MDRVKPEQTQDTSQDASCSKSLPGNQSQWHYTMTTTKSALAQWGCNPNQLPNTDIAVPKWHALHLAMGRQSRRPLHDKVMFTLPWGCIAVRLVLESWLGLRPEGPIQSPAHRLTAGTHCHKHAIRFVAPVPLDPEPHVGPHGPTRDSLFLCWLKSCCRIE